MDLCSRLQCCKNISGDVLLLLKVGTVHRAALLGGQFTKLIIQLRTLNFSGFSCVYCE